MAKITSFDKQNLSVVRAAITLALAKAGADLGIDLSIGGISYTGNTFTTKITATVAGDASADVDTKNTKWKADFLNQAMYYGMSPADFGKEITIGGVQFKIAGMRPKARKNGIMVLERKDGGCVAWDVHAVAKALKS